MFALLATSLSAYLAIGAITIMAACALVAVVGTRIVRSKQRRQCRQERLGQQARHWRPARKPEPPKESN